MHYSKDSRALLLGLLSRCPFTSVDSGCPLREARSGNVPEMKELAFDRMSDAEVKDILEHHAHCQCLRDNPLLRRNMAA